MVLSEDDERRVNNATHVLNRFGDWWLHGDTLVRFVRYCPIGAKWQVATPATGNVVVEWAASCGVQSLVTRDGDIVLSMDGFSITVHPGARQLRTERRLIDYMYPYSVQVPANYGTYLDEWRPGWFVDAPKPALAHLRETGFFSDARCRFADRLLTGLCNAARRTGCYEASFLGFGGLLGVVMCGAWIPADDDMDFCFLSDRISAREERALVEEFRRVGSFADGVSFYDYRERQLQSTSTGRALWTSLGPQSIRRNGVKSCVWWWQRYKNRYWHSKGRKWIGQQRKFNRQAYHISSDDEAVCLGIPAHLLSDLIEIDYAGGRVQVPKMAGNCCDYWYPGWRLGVGGSSRRVEVLVVGSWKDEKTWRVV